MSLMVISDVLSARQPFPLCPRFQTYCCLAANDVQDQLRRSERAEFCLFDHFVGKRKQVGRDFEAESLGGFQIDDELELRRLHDRQIVGFGPLENLAGIDPRLSSLMLGP
jgi:hypothetical protein